MALLEQWKAAKEDFKKKTDVKKPAKKFLGVRQSTGIEDACKDVDKAKTVGDMEKAIATLQQKSEAYVRELIKVCSDPESVPTKDKPAYLGAVEGLKKALLTIRSEADLLLEEIKSGGGGKKDKIDSKAVQDKVYNKAKDDADAKLKVLEQAEKDAKNLVQKINDNGKKLEQVRSAVAKQVQAARTAASKSDTLNHQVAVGVIDRFITEAEKVATSTRELYDSVAVDERGALMVGRKATNITGLPPAENKKYRDQAMTVFKRVSKIAVDAGTAMGNVNTAVEELRAAKALAEASGSLMKDPKVVLKELTELNDEVVKYSKDLDTKISPMRKSLTRTAEILNATQEAMERHVNPLRDKIANYRPLFTAAKSRFGFFETRAKANAAANSENDAIAGAAKLVVSNCTQGKKAIDEGIQVLADLEKDLDKIDEKLAEFGG
jgi:hypothetical protein